jgi:hypothetical protein
LNQRSTEEIVASAEDRGLALWRAIQEATRIFPQQTDVMTVGEAGGEIVVVRIHCIHPDVFTDINDVDSLFNDAQGGHHAY